MTHTADRVPEMHLDASPEVGFSLVDTRLAPPRPGSVEAALVDAGHRATITLTDIRRSPRDEAGDPLLDRIRSQSAEPPTAVPDAFDAVLSTPTSTTYFTTVMAGS
jgi:erythromycin esterase